MGAGAWCKAGSTPVGGCCTASRVCHADAEPILVHNSITSDEQAEHAEIARIIEALARPASRTSEPDTLNSSLRFGAAHLSTEEHGELEAEPVAPQALKCCRESQDLSGAEITLPHRKYYAGLSALELSSDPGFFSRSCTADIFLELIELDEDRPEAPRSSKPTNFGCGLGSDANTQTQQQLSSNSQTRSADWGLSAPGVNVQPLEGAIQILAWEVAKRSCSPETTSPEGGLQADGSTFSGSSIQQVAFAMPTNLLFDNGSHRCSNGSICTGQWSGKMLDGYGIERWPDGSVFVGDFRNGDKHGAGRLAWVSGSVYEGEFDSDCMHGEGVYLWTDGLGYSGQWTYNQPGSYGTMRCSDGHVYTGEFIEGKMHGVGRLQWPDGRSFDGQWSEGLRHGAGVFQTASGHRRESLWHHGNLLRWLSALDADTSNEERSLPIDASDAVWEIPNSARQSPRNGAPVRDVASEVLQLTVESCSHGPCKAEQQAEDT